MGRLVYQEEIAAAIERIEGDPQYVSSAEATGHMQSQVCSYIVKIDDALKNSDPFLSEHAIAVYVFVRQGYFCSFEEALEPLISREHIIFYVGYCGKILERTQQQGLSSGQMVLDLLYTPLARDLVGLLDDNGVLFRRAPGIIGQNLIYSVNVPVTAGALFALFAPGLFPQRVSQQSAQYELWIDFRGEVELRLSCDLGNAGVHWRSFSLEQVVVPALNAFFENDIARVRAENQESQVAGRPGSSRQP